jgi:DNA-binding CsgD family transcriptional regulator
VSGDDGWPIVERWELLELIRAAEHGAVLVGPGGVGKSTAAHLAAEPGQATVSITGIEGLAAIPFGALQLAEMTADDPAAAARPMTADDDAVTHLQGWFDDLAAHSVLLVIDDPAHLDAESIGLLADQVRRGRRATITHRSDQPVPDELLEASEAAGFVTIEVAPLDESMVALAVELATGGEPTAATAAQLAALSGGNPMLLREIVRDLTGRDLWVRGDDGLALADDADPSPRLGSLLEARVPSDEDQLRCLELIAHAGSITRALAARLAPPAAVDDLVASGWIAGSDVLTITHPLMRQFVAERLDAVRLRRRLLGALDRVGDAAGLDATSRLQCLRWSFAVDRDLEVDELRWGRREASRRFDSELACLIADRLSRLDPSVDTTIELALVLAQAERYDEAVTVLRAGQALAAEPAEVVDVARFLLRFSGPLARLTGLGEPPEGLEVEVARWADDRLGTTAFTDLLAALEALATGALADACDRADQVRATGLPGFGDPDELIMVSSLYLGDETRALEAFARLETHLVDAGYRHPKAVVIDAAASSLLMLAGRFEDAFAYDGAVADVARTTDDHERAREMTGHRGMTALFTGRVTDAIESFTRFRGYPAKPGSLRTLYTAGFAQALALAGRLDEAERVLADAEREAGLVAALMLPDYENMVAMTLVLLGHTDAGEARMRSALRYSIDNRVGRAELMALHGLARMDRVRPVDLARVAELPPHVTSGAPGFTSGVLTMVEARHHGDPNGLATAAGIFAATEFGIGAAEAYAAAVRAAPDRRSTRAQRWLAALDELLGRSPGLVGATVMVDRGVDVLTDREREVASLAAGGLPNVEIAMRLGLSVRTVENNLHRVFTKLAISGRADLTAALVPAAAGLTLAPTSSP